jgi:hypothetical protein
MHDLITGEVLRVATFAVMQEDGCGATLDTGERVLCIDARLPNQFREIECSCLKQTRAALTAALPLIRAGVEAKLNAAYLAGFNASGEGWNGEWPFQDKGRDPTEDEHWCECRATTIRKLGAGDA